MNAPRAIARVLATATMLCAVAISFAAAQSAPTHPNFNGAWVFDSARSEASTFTPVSGTYLVRQTADSFIVDRSTTGATGNVTKAHMVYGFDGKAWKNTLPLVGQTVEQGTVLSWDAGALVLHSTAQAGDAELVQVDRWSLSPDGNTLTIKRQATYGGTPFGSPTWIFNKR